MFSAFRQASSEPASLASAANAPSNNDPNDPVNIFRKDLADVDSHKTRLFRFTKYTEGGLPKHDVRELVLTSKGIEVPTNVVVSAASISITNTFPFSVLVSVNGLNRQISTPYGEKQGVLYVDAFKSVPLRFFYNGKKRAEPVLRNRELVQTILDSNVEPATQGAMKFDVLREETLTNPAVVHDDNSSVYQAAGSASTVTPYKILDTNHPFYLIATQNSIDLPGFDSTTIIKKEYGRAVYQKWLTHHYNAVLAWTRENIFEKFNVVDISANALKVTVAREDGNSFSSWEGASPFAEKSLLEKKAMGVSIDLELTYYLRA